MTEKKPKNALGWRVIAGTWRQHFWFLRSDLTIALSACGMTRSRNVIHSEPRAPRCKDCEKGLVLMEMFRDLAEVS